MLYKIRGADGKDYGPVDSDTVRRWLVERRANAQTLVQAEGAAAWSPLGGVPEFAASLGAAPNPPGFPPPLPATSPARPRQTSGLAIASLVLGILGICTAGVTAFAGLILGVIAMVRIDRGKGRLGGKGLAISGLCVSGVMMLFGFALAMALLLPAMAKMKRGGGRTTTCAANLRQVALAVRLYANDNSDALPDAAKWCDLIQPHLASTSALQCPSDSGQPPCSFGFNAALGGKDGARVNAKTVMLFEMNGGWNASGGSESAVSRHGRNYVVAYADGSVEQVNAARFPQLRWEP
jgi:prepilin-type processing-associated H-X9-DG protein